ncbi:hypothetical protein RND71_015924 [Anisodus tanguticus]|uniref:Uncharacterized protein n=1 Tax=Anisodus tanguticus TaxID=243964 RepID=A0AAE1S8X2_9SOLA|nr:hypothetical protein RND71_015924 [Anisodus tanguticus]
MTPKSSYRRSRLAPRCRLITSSGVEEGPKGSVVRRFKWEKRGANPSTKRTRVGLTYGVPVVMPIASARAAKLVWKNSAAKRKSFSIQVLGRGFLNENFDRREALEMAFAVRGIAGETPIWVILCCLGPLTNRTNLKMTKTRPLREKEVWIPEELTEKGRRIGSLERQNGVRRWIGLLAGENTD